jgi:transaldolase / glucose-6-phosphate isomerase
MVHFKDEGSPMMSEGTAPIRLDMRLGSLEDAVRARLAAWEESRFLRWLWRRDPILWSRVPRPELADRLGWLDLPETMRGALSDFEAFARELQDEGIERVVLLGMGGSSLAPEVLQRTFPPLPGRPDLVVLDTLHPEAIRTLSDALDIQKTFFLVSSKSGTTLETRCLLDHFWESVARTSRSPGKRFCAITDPGTPLDTLAWERGFRACFHAHEEVGGRYSALSHFGLLPAALLGLDLGRLLDSARGVARDCSPETPAPECAALRLGAALGELALAGRDKVTLITSPSLSAVPAWIEQLVAESTGKSGRGILPVIGEPALELPACGPDRFFIALSLDGEEGRGPLQNLEMLRGAGHPVAQITLRDRTELAGLFYLWEVATAAACSALGVNPFDQPDVQLAKEMTRGVLDRGVPASGAGPESPVAAADAPSLQKHVRFWCSLARPGDYACIQAFLSPDLPTAAALRRLRATLENRLAIATVDGFGPRYLHSTGQFHKGGPNTGLFLQVVDSPVRDLSLPGTGTSFGALIRSQAEGDALALASRGRRIVRVDLGPEAPEGLARLERAIASSGPAPR